MDRRIKHVARHRLGLSGAMRVQRLHSVGQGRSCPRRAPAIDNIVERVQETDVVLCKWGLFCAEPAWRGSNRA